MSGKPRVAVTRRWPEQAEARLAELFDVQLNEDDHPMSTEELQEAMRTADAVFPTVSDRIDAAVLEAQPRRARILGNFGVGFNHIDLEAARQAGIVVTNTPEVLTECTADIAMILLLTVARRGGEGERQLRAGQWSGWRPTHLLGTRVSGKILGLVGFGRIAQAVARRAFFGFGMRILYYDPYMQESDAAREVQAVQISTLEELLAQPDFVSLHCPGGKETRHLINGERLALLQPHAFLINTSRGDVVDEDALVMALQEGRIAGAGFDVYEQEPTVHPGLLQRENVVLLPHLGSASRETRVAMGMRAIENVQAFFAGQSPPDRIV